MTYFVGIDIGTTYTAAAVWRDGKAEIASLGHRTAAVPSVLLFRDDGELLVGDAAERRAPRDPERVVREFKRRMGDPTPLIVGGVPYSADALVARLLRWVVDRIAVIEGGPAACVSVSHPATWGPYKRDLLRQAFRQAGLDDVVEVAEPEAAAVHYASQERVDSGAVIAVYDLGGGTFDVALLQKSDQGFRLLGEPEGVERLGGVDFDQAVFDHVSRVTGQSWESLDPDALATRTAVARLRHDCIEAKEALSADSDVAIPVLLPSVHTEVRLTRGEFEAMLRPRLQDTVAALERALRSADLKTSDVTTVLLVGGSSRIPLVAELVSTELGRPVAVDAHPKYCIALGAARLAAAGTTTAPVPEPEPEAEAVIEPLPADPLPPRPAGARAGFVGPLVAAAGGALVLWSVLAADVRWWVDAALPLPDAGDVDLAGFFGPYRWLAPVAAPWLALLALLASGRRAPRWAAALTAGVGVVLLAWHLAAMANLAMGDDGLRPSLGALLGAGGYALVVAAQWERLPHRPIVCAVGAIALTAGVLGWPFVDVAVRTPLTLAEVRDWPDWHVWDKRPLLNLYAQQARYVVPPLVVAAVAVALVPRRSRTARRAAHVVAGLCGLVALGFVLALYNYPAMDTSPTVGGSVGVVGFAGLAAGQYLSFQPMSRMPRSPHVAPPSMASSAPVM